MTRSSARAILIGMIGLLLVALPATATLYTIRLHDGSSFVTRYQPQDASYDSSKIQFLSDFGNWICLSKDSVAQIITDTESKGFGTVIDNTTIMLGAAPNDTGEMAGGDEEMARAQAAMQQSLGAEPPPPYSMPMVSEPNSGGGIPMGWMGLTTPPMSGSSSFEPSTGEGF